MRDPRPGLIWSRQRVARRTAYDCWMASHEWADLRRRWYRDFVSRYGCEPVCMICEATWKLTGGDLHHRTYLRLGRECFEDLLPVDRGCHDRIHALWDSSPAWRRVDRSLANDLIVGLLRRAAATRPNE